LSAPTTITAGFAMAHPQKKRPDRDDRFPLFPVPALGANMAETRENSIRGTTARHAIRTEFAEQARRLMSAPNAVPRDPADRPSDSPMDGERTPIRLRLHPRGCPRGRTAAGCRFRAEARRHAAPTQAGAGRAVPHSVHRHIAPMFAPAPRPRDG